MLTEFPNNIQKLVKKVNQPDFMLPMKAILIHEYFSKPDWIYERKLDGERCIINKKNTNITIYSRNKKNKNGTYPEIVQAVSKLSGNFILDGEVVTFDGEITSFAKLQHRIHVKKADNKLINEFPVYVYIFDILYLEDSDITQLPLHARKMILEKTFIFIDPLRYLKYRTEEGEKYFNEACKKEWEGLIAKNINSAYLHKRSKEWLKFKCSNGQEFVVGGYTAPKGNRIGFGALLLGYYNNDRKLKYAGRVGTGFNDEFLKNFYHQMIKIKRKSSPFSDFKESDKEINWIKPQYVAEIRFREWTDENKLRHPRFVGLRDDKNPESVRKEVG